ncbi:AT-rich interactive domain-containing protein 6-like isoform X2 [Fagus crenata]
MSDTKENENEESDQEHVAVGSDEHEPHQPDSQNGNKIMESLSNPDLPTHDSPPSQLPLTNQQDLVKPEPHTQPASDVKTEDHDLLQKTNSDARHNYNIASEPPIALAKTEPSQVVPDTKIIFVLWFLFINFDFSLFSM